MQIRNLIVAAIACADLLASSMGAPPRAPADKLAANISRRGSGTAT
jgi:hypothetical protein